MSVLQIVEVVCLGVGIPGAFWTLGDILSESYWSLRCNRTRWRWLYKSHDDFPGSIVAAEFIKKFWVVVGCLLGGFVVGLKLQQQLGLLELIS